MTLASSDIAGRTGKILSRFPSFMLAPTPSKALAAVAFALGSELDEDERIATAIQRSHRIEVATEAGDVLKLGAALTLHPADFFIVSALYAGEYPTYVEAVRDGVRRAIAVLLDGCGTIWALLEGSALLLAADQLNGRTVEHLDDFVHRVQTTRGAIYLVENPLLDKDSGDVARVCRETFRVTRGGFFDGPVTIQITGVGDRTVHPLMIDRTTHEGVGYRGVLSDGQHLVFTAENTALLDGVDVTADAYHLAGALFDDSVFGDPFVVFGPLETLTMPLGDNDWRFSVEEGAFDVSSFGGAVFECDGSAPSGSVELFWEENEPFAATVLIPSELQALQPQIDGDLPTLVRAGLERFRTAGIRLDVRSFDEAWILGHSVLTSLDAPAGDGVDFDATIPSGAT